MLTVRSRLAELEKSEQEREQATREMQKLLLEGRFDDAVKAFNSVPAGRVTNDQRNLAVAALMLAGGSEYDEARKLDQRFRSSNHIRPPCRAYRPRCERRAPD